VKLYVKVIAFSEEDGIKSTREEIVEVSGKTLKLNEAIMGSDPEEIVSSIATSALIAALQSVQATSVQAQMESVQSSGPIGGRRNPQAPNAPPKVDPLSKALELDRGLEIIEAMDRKEFASQAHAPRGPGPIGFGSHRGR
jgi:hypothetical protein